MARVLGVNQEAVEPYIKRVFHAQTKKWGGALLNHEEAAEKIGPRL